MSMDWILVLFLFSLFSVIWIPSLFASFSIANILLVTVTFITLLICTVAIVLEIYSKAARARRTRLRMIREIPEQLLVQNKQSVSLGFDVGLRTPVFLPNDIRTRHVHILGATGSGKTESVILNFLRQDIANGLGSIILDAKGDASFLASLRKRVPADKLRVFDLGSKESLPYNPLAAGSSLESAQRLFSSLTWSEEYYKSRAFSVLQKIYEIHSTTKGTNPTLADLANYLEDAEKYAAVMGSNGQHVKTAKRDFEDLSGLRDQIKTLCIGHLSSILSPRDISQIQLEQAYHGEVIYFRLQSLMSPQLVNILGKLVINHLNYLAGVAHREEVTPQPRKIVPTYFDEFASFACPEFADLISKARSAGFALHFSHQSIGDLAEVGEGFLNRITDCSATKIILRINDPDSAEFFARSFGTKLYQKITQRITNVVNIDNAEVVGEGTQREAHQFRASPDLFKSLPTGVGSVLIAHGYDTPHGASSVFKIKFPKLEEETRK